MSPAELAARLGLHRSGRDWRGTCPACGYGNEAFALTSKGGQTLGYCASCRDRGAIAVALANAGAGLQPAEPATSASSNDPAQRVAAALAVWNGAIPAAGTLADIYLSSRGLPGLAASPALRWRPDVSHPSGGGARHPAMVAPALDVTGAPRAVHRTFLDRNGRKANLIPVKASLGPIAGCAIRLDPVGDELVIGEGLESSASAGILLGLPAWAAVSAGNLAAALALPLAVRHVTVAADRDGPGQKAAQEAATRWRLEGRTVRVATPDRDGQDFNDVLRKHANA